MPDAQPHPDNGGDSISSLYPLSPLSLYAGMHPSSASQTKKGIGIVKSFKYAIGDTIHAFRDVTGKLLHADTVLAGYPKLQKSEILYKPANTRKELTERLHHYFDGAALAGLMAKMDTDPKNQQKVIRAYVQAILQDIFPYITCYRETGALVNFDYPKDYDDLERQIMELIEGIEDASHDRIFDLLGLFGEVQPMEFRRMQEEIDNLQQELSGLDENDPKRAAVMAEYKEKYPAYMELYKSVYESKKEIFEIFRSAAEKVRKDVAFLLHSELRERGIGSDIYTLGGYYGEGGIGAVHSCRINGRDVAVKLHHPDSKLKTAGRNKLITATASSPYLVRYYGSLGVHDDQIGKNKRELDVFEEVKEGMNLSDYMALYEPIKTNNPENPALKAFFGSIFLPFLKGVKALHENKLMHRDLKPENVMIVKDPGNQQFGGISALKITDYDLAAEEDGNTDIQGGISGSPQYMSPEQWRNAPDMTRKSDIFSLGMILYNLLGGILPTTITGIYAKISEGDLDVNSLNVPENVKKVITLCLRKNPDDRPDIDRLISYTEALSMGMDPISGPDIGLYEYDEMVVEEGGAEQFAA